MKRLTLVVTASYLVLASMFAQADELIMIHNPFCGYCQAFISEVEPTYDESEFAKQYPLTIIDVTNSDVVAANKWLATALEQNRRGRVVGTPTFFVWKGDRETGKAVGTILGYERASHGGGKEWFYNRLKEILAQGGGEG